VLLLFAVVLHNTQCVYFIDRCTYTFITSTYCTIQGARMAVVESQVCYLFTIIVSLSTPLSIMKE
jgi:hypothetical protein